MISSSIFIGLERYNFLNKKMKNLLFRNPKDFYQIAVVTGHRFNDYENRLLEPENFAYAIGYANQVMKKRWPELEKKLLESKSGEYLVKYVERVLNYKRWPEAEPYIRQNMNYGFFYAIKALHMDTEDARKWVKE